MDGKKLSILLLVLSPVFIAAWTTSREDRREARVNDRDPRRTVHYHSKRHMLPEPESKRRATTPRAREFRKKPSGHLTPLEEDDIDNDEVISVAIGPPPIRPKYDKVHWKHPPKAVSHNVSNATATNLVKDIIVQLGREFLSRQVSEDFVFGQYVGNAMKNLTADVKLRMQHEVLELIVKYQRLSKGDATTRSEEKVTSTNTLPILKDIKMEKKFANANETEDTWPDFSNLAKIVG
ncbi:uncharacterized protein LOC126055277 [Helicoverpa armigera]|uniref:Uncharacterized protein n=1 Tax=Helicoverpa armigera TaxID=29058 RepID=A0A2W1BRM3_HELAM|nr:uncharacterized protein LOC126055277 [Helicoverpa armigera]PZC77729.1 hypothetical protein B5X24_HaOG203029 [Helicoverpa armigera]